MKSNMYLSKLFYLILSFFVLSCSNETLPTPNKLSQNLGVIPSNTVISVIAKDNHNVPKSDGVIEEPKIYAVLDNIYDEDGVEVLIPKGAIVTGIYSNDGVTCKVSWQALYANKKAYSQKQGTLNFRNVTQPSFCNPQRGIKANNRLTIRFN